MSQIPTRQSPDPATKRPPSRFQVAAPAEASPSLLRQVGFLLALMLLVVGVPALLVGLSGPPPVPTSLPGREELARSIGMEQVLTVLVAIVWLAWLQFVTCLIVEVFSTIRHHGVPAPVPFSGPSQRLARALVGGLLLAGVFGGQVATVVNAVGGDGARSATTISAGVQTGGAVTRSGSPVAGQSASVLTRASLTPAAEVTTGKGTLQAPRSESTDPLSPLGKKIYTVRAPVGHSHESLWEIAERHLGDGRRYKEIFALNIGLPQSDGTAMHLARMIQPGWQLVMPEDAVGVARLVPPPATPAEPVAPLTSWGADTVGETHNPVQEVVGAGDVLHVSDGSKVDLQATQTQANQMQVAPVNPLVAGLATNGLFGACVLSALLM